MVKILIVYCAFFSAAFSAYLKEDLQNLLGVDHPKINTFLANQKKFINAQGNVNYNALCSELIKQNLLKFNDDTNVKLSFSNKSQNTILLIKLVTQTLNNMGYKYFLTSEFENSPLSWSVVLSSRGMINPAVLYDEFLKHNVYITKITRQVDDSFMYELDLRQAIVQTDKISSNTTKPKSPYFIGVENKKHIEIKANQADSWQPFIRIFDRNLKLISNEQITQKTYELQLDLPANSAYMLIDDVSSLENIKFGLSINLE